MFEDSEFIYPYYRLIEAGAIVDVIGVKKGSYGGKHGTTAKTTQTIDGLQSSAYDALYIPGGYAPDRLRRSAAMVAFVRSAYEEGKIICTVCHGPSLLISADILGAKRVTGYPSIGDDLLNAGAVYTAEAVEQDGTIITARDPKALPEMMKRFLALLGA
jgi:protease I